MARIVSLEALCASIRPGERLFVPGSSGEPTAFLEWLTADPERSREIDILTTLIPGINAIPMELLHPTARVTGLFMQPSFRAAHRAGRFRHLPMSYAEFAKHLEARAEIDTTIVQVSLPDEHGMVSLGPAVEFTPLAMRRSRRTLALINRRTPSLKGSPSFPLSDFAFAAEVDNPLKGYDVGAPTAVSDMIARKLAPFIRDGDALQIGLGKVPGALLGLVGDRRNLRLSSGMLADGAAGLADAGALDASFRHTSCVWVGSRELYEGLRQRPEFTVAGCEETHDLRRLISLDRFIAINSALSIDLFGQANLEHAEGKAVSGVGGAADFAAAARRSRGGLSIVAMPASFGRANKSRIVSRLGDGIASLPRDAIDLAVTECGVADLRGLCVHQRAEALIAIAAPEARGDLTEAWRAMRAAL